jgi:hypothetical protein
MTLTCPGDRVVPKAQFGIEATTLSRKRHQVQAPGNICPYLDSENPAWVRHSAVTPGGILFTLTISPFLAPDLVTELGACHRRRKFDYYVEWDCSNSVSVLLLGTTRHTVMPIEISISFVVRFLQYECM